MDLTQINAVRCVLCPKTFASEVALSNHVRVEHDEAYQAGDCSAWVLIDDDSVNEKTETDTVKCLLCTKGFASEVALKNHAKLQHSNAFETADPSIWKYEKASRHQFNTKKRKKSHNYLNEFMQVDTEEENSGDEYKQMDEMINVDIKREMDENEDLNYNLPVETIIEEARCYVDSVAAFVELTDSECTVEESNPPPSRHVSRRGNYELIHRRMPPPKQLTATRKQFTCDVCGKTFNQQNNLYRHYRTHTNDKPYKCQICDKGFTQLNNLERHNKIHTCEKQFQCPVCKKCFNQKNNLKRHFRTHTSEKPFQCVLCEKSFSQKNNLERHFRCHTGEEQFVCFICKMAFNQKNNLVRHMRVHDVNKKYHHKMIKQIV